MEPTAPVALALDHSGNPAQIEIGGPFVGVEMHRSSPLLSRVSLFYPLANSIDLSTSYWQRDQFRVLFLGLKVGSQTKRWIGLEPFDVQLTPYSARLSRLCGDTMIEVTYQFCLSRPAMVATIGLTNHSEHAELYELYTHLEATLRTCHTYASIDKAWTEFDETASTIYVGFDDLAAGATQVFVANAGERPTSFAANGETLGSPGTGNSWWMNHSGDLPGGLVAGVAPERPVAAFAYRRMLAPGEKMAIVQIIGSCPQGEGRPIVSYLRQHHQREVDLYEASVFDQALREGVLETGDSAMDHTSRWAKAVLAANAHYLDGQIVPMPCPAEYNYFFTHDVLMTDLAAVHYDTARAKRDLQYIVAKADGTVPQAYYWKDDRYVTEQAPADSWNHLWFILLSASYLRHSGDTETLQDLYPYLSASVRLAMTCKGADQLMWSHHPDWWDIGDSFGPRSYMTILAIRALRDFVYMSTVLGEPSPQLRQHEQLAATMQEQLNARLWDEEQSYLINYHKDGRLDTHLYAGSLLAAHFALMGRQRTAALVATAKRALLDEQLGVRNVFPADFHLLTEELSLRPGEVGEPGLYMNGGIWAHANAWYALALISLGRHAEASRFMKRTMTLEGVSAGPNGQPAMYECRNSNRARPSAYGAVDKPQFLWAAGWYLYALYNLLGVRENVWNIALEPYVLQGQAASRFSLFVNGKRVTVTATGRGRYVRSIEYDGKPCPTAVIPASRVGEDIVITLGTAEVPYVAHTNSMLTSCRFDHDQKSLVADLEAFPGHESETQVISPWLPSCASINGVRLDEGWRVQQDGDIYRTDVSVSQRCFRDTMQLRF
jgi:cellobiose phosphorylase